MTFQNEKKTFLEKSDVSKKGSIDTKALPIINTINQLEDYYTTSSCSGRVYFWKGDGKKNNTEWINVSHDLITQEFFNIDTDGLIWLRYEGFIIHIACKDLEKANELLKLVQSIYKKSSILTISNKIIIEIRDSQFIEMPYKNNELLFSGSLEWLKDTINEKLQQNWDKINKLNKKIKNLALSSCTNNNC